MALGAAGQAVINAIKSGNGASTVSAAFQAQANAKAGVETTDPGDAARDSDLDAADIDSTTYSGDQGDSDSTSIDATDETDVKGATDEPADDDARADAESAGDGDDGDAEEPDVETVTFKGPDGQKVKVEIDYADRAKIKKAYAAQAGMRKFQAERDAARSELSKSTEKYKQFDEMKGMVDKLETAWKEGGEDGIIKLLSKGSRSLKQAAQELATHEAWLAKASPLEREAFERNQAAEKREAAAKEREEEHSRKLKELDDRAHQSDKATFESMLHPAFEEVRFAGKLGNVARELELDEAIWASVEAKIKRLPDDVDVTPTVVKDLFRRTAKALNSTVDAKVKEKVSAAVDQRKKEATRSVQRTIKDSQQAGRQETSLRDAVRTGGVASAIMNALRAGRKG